MALPNTFTNGSVADADEVNANFTEVYIQKADGTLTGSNTRYDDTVGQYDDISFSAAELGTNDSILIEILPFNPTAGEQTNVQIEINDITTPLDIIEITASGDTNNTYKIQLSSTPIQTQTITYDLLKKVDTTLSCDVGVSSSSGENDPLTTAFTMRINSKRVGGSGTFTLKYRVSIQKGYN